MARKRQFNEPMLQRAVYISVADLKWLQDNRYSLSNIVREKIKELQSQN